MSEIIKRIPPHSIESEQACIGAMLTNNQKVISQIVSDIEQDDFFDPKHNHIFKAIKYLYENCKPVDTVTVSEIMEKSGTLQKIGSAYISQLSDQTPSVSSVKHYIEIVKDKKRLRNTIEAARRIIDNAYKNQDSEAVLSYAEKSILSISRGIESNANRKYSDILTETMNEIKDKFATGQTSTGIMTGFSKLDSLTNGFGKGQMIIIGSRPKMGKTALMFSIAKQAALSGKRGLIFSAEMSDIELAYRDLSASSRLSLQSVKRGNLKSDQNINNDEWVILDQAYSESIKANLIINDTGHISIEKIERESRREYMEGALDFIIIDHMNIITCETRKNTRYELITEVSARLKALAKELKLPVIILSQLSRALEMRADKRPIASDLRESGAVEQDADMIIFLYRDDYYNKESPAYRNQMEIDLHLHRDGPTGVTRVYCDLSKMIIEDFPSHISGERGKF